MPLAIWVMMVFFFRAEDGIRAADVTGVQTCALPIYPTARHLLRAGFGNIRDKVKLVCATPGDGISIPATALGAFSMGGIEETDFPFAALGFQCHRCATIFLPPPVGIVRSLPGQQKFTHLAGRVLRRETAIVTIVSGTAREECRSNNRNTPTDHSLHNLYHLIHLYGPPSPYQGDSSSSLFGKLRPNPSAPRRTTTMDTSGAGIGSPCNCTITVLPKGGKGFSPATIKTPPSEISRVS